ncbi:sigma-70 family RNA polymerase sigma factor [Bacillus cereus]|uniref:sigma-70 family RNA polymerase sigma factor n=1 Tax=Bacillus cereus TaxID=1396 RepID=UPI000B4AFD1B|nr:sigma-70 family RNA polymerase sigma factor [Bacillus cereus]
MNSSPEELWERFGIEKSQELRNQIVNKYINLVNKVANKMKYPDSIEKQDIRQYGIIGLIKAVDKYDKSLGARFEHYASIKIQGEILDQLRQFGKQSQGVSRTTIKRIRELEKAKKDLFMKKNDKVNEKELMEYLNLGEKEFSQLQFKTQIYNGISIDAFYENPRYEIKYTQEPTDTEGEIILEEINNKLPEYIKKLKDVEREVIENYYFKMKNTGYIANMLGVTQARVSQIHHDAIRKLRLMINNE